MKALHFGAGNIGRGFIGYLLNKSDYKVTFVDPIEHLVNDINNYGKYEIITLGDIKKAETVSGVNAIALSDTKALEDAVLNTDIITTSIGVNHLQETGKMIAPMLKKRSMVNSSAPLDIIACENALFATEILRKSVYKYADEDLSDYLDKKVGFPSCVVDRIVPNTNIKKNSPIDIAVGESFEWDIERKKIKLNNKITYGKYVDNLKPYMERKLFLLNGAHATIAYLGSLKKYKFVHEALQDQQILQAVKEFLAESSEALRLKHHFESEELKQYSERLIKRFKNPYLMDNLSRVGRDPLRKLGKDDRLVSPLLLCESYCLPDEAVILAVAAGFAFFNDSDKSAVDIQKRIEQYGISKTIENVTGIVENPKLVERIVEKYKMLKAI